MAFRYDQGSEIIEIIIRDSSGGKIETYKFKVSDPRAISTLNSLRRKYGLEGSNKDLNWLR